MPDLDLRLVRYFTVVAEHAHFGRAAEALHVAQPSLSRQVRRLEDLVGTPLLERTPQGSTLTDAGRAFLPRALELVRAADDALVEARSAATPQRLVVGWAGDLVVTDVVRALRHAHPDADVTTRHVGWDELRDALLERRVDLVVGRAPFGAEGLDVEVLHEQARVLVVPLDHRLAGKEQVELDDFAHEPLVRSVDPVRDAFWRIDPRPDGSRAPDGPLGGEREDKFELVASGEALTLMPAPGPDSRLRAGLTTVPVEGIAPCQVVVATRSAERRALVRRFVALARDHLHPDGAPPPA
ncbi:LysR family transcriptional regulator [Nocardioides sp.]|uniref:LysR family transcriptional regulator n=1 Tax=Nocardioides sp. TaxID=35761 RepID=UPI0027184C42|nr:LysR substrate-binding domain-containing protein [Nocardioides sp.]MDO9455628.1 LysR family transcriptional regulator [Nocardioides sp.]